MSYLFTLYVRYHGDNLASYGILIGSEEIETYNQGLKRPEEIDPTKVDPNLIESVKRQEQLSNAEDYESILRNAILKSQKESYNLYKTGLVGNTMYENTPQALIDDYNNYGPDISSGSLFDTGSSLDFFDEANHMGKYDPMINNKPW